MYMMFSSPLTLGAMGVIAVIYIAMFFAKFIRSRIPMTLLVVLNIAAHLVLMVLCTYIKATVAEFMFVLVASTALSLIVTAKRGGCEK